MLEFSKPFGVETTAIGSAYKQSGIIFISNGNV